MPKPKNILLGDGDGFSRLKPLENFYRDFPYSTNPSLWPAGSTVDTRGDYVAGKDFRLAFVMNTAVSEDVGLGWDIYSGEHVVCEDIGAFNALNEGKVGILVNGLTGDDYQKNVNFFWKYAGFGAGLIQNSTRGLSLPTQDFTQINFTARPPDTGDNSDLSLFMIGHDRTGISPYGTGGLSDSFHSYRYSKNITTGEVSNTWNANNTDTGNATYPETLPNPTNSYEFVQTDVQHFHPSYLLLDVYTTDETNVDNYDFDDCIGRVFYGTMLKVKTNINKDTIVGNPTGTVSKSVVIERIGQTMPRNNTYGRNGTSSTDRAEVSIITIGGLNFFHSRYEDLASGADQFGTDAISIHPSATYNSFFNSLRTFS